jgi:hypothetical protein
MSTSLEDPSSRSQTSLSPSNSQSHSMSHPDVSLQTLVSHLLASKRSLSSIDTVWRANEIVTAARAALEESVILGARTEFLRNGISGQVKILRRVRGGIEGVYKDGQKDFKVRKYNGWEERRWDPRTDGVLECYQDPRCCELEVGRDDGCVEVNDGGSGIQA